MERAAQQFNGREGETATLLSRGLFTLNLRGGGFTPRQLNRSAFLGYNVMPAFLVLSSNISQSRSYIMSSAI